MQAGDKQAWHGLGMLTLGMVACVCDMGDSGLWLSCEQVVSMQSMSKQL